MRLTGVSNTNTMQRSIHSPILLPLSRRESAMQGGGVNAYNAASHLRNRMIA